MSGEHALTESFEKQRVVAVATIERASDALPLADALCAGGVRVLEITLRTGAACAAIEHIRKARPDAIVGAGTVRDARGLRAARDAGALFVVSPGFTRALHEAAAAAALPWLPGVATASEILLAQEAGHALLKFFPAEAAGGARALRAFAAVFPEVRFCPTGGVTAENVRSYLELPNVVCVGGTWLAPQALMAAQQWSKIQELAARAVEIARPA
ncbi:MAG TPA: bifunctional 4-hydroxy-2-oxoglutarate aldolase/2-dehydro-3-deoxy-phosphogluconate aldolase [Gammaproteobacteria bacterium]|nr:bifunctional 4-hydroxy-2-oxoglutarate aldolase/2-dehydro-3-deoxy-phosphogluconate aldolase [Gammaproteobacteria bacterium]